LAGNPLSEVAAVKLILRSRRNRGVPARPLRFRRTGRGAVLLSHHLIASSHD